MPFSTDASAIASTALLVSAMVGGLLVVTRKHHQIYTADPFEGAQKLHSESTPRVGGVAIYLGVLAAYAVASGLHLRVAPLLAVLLLAGLPAWLLGLAEDITKKVRPRWRMLATMASGLLASLMTGLSLRQVGVPGLDAALQWAPVALLFTAFAVAGVANAVNLIDGMNGLASGFSCVAFGALVAVAHCEGDITLMRYCMVLCAASLGFMLLNWPRGKLFLGDSGSYFLGFALAWACVQMTQRNPSVATFSMLLICIHPIFEAIFSMWRRAIRGQSPAHADRLHLHSLLLRRVVRNPASRFNVALRTLSGAQKWDFSHGSDWVSNAAAGLLVACMSLPAALASYLTHENSTTAVIACMGFVVGYVTIYARLVRFRWFSPLRFLFERPEQQVMQSRGMRRG